MGNRRMDALTCSTRDPDRSTSSYLRPYHWAIICQATMDTVITTLWLEEAQLSNRGRGYYLQSLQMAS